MIVSKKILGLLINLMKKLFITQKLIKNSYNQLEWCLENDWFKYFSKKNVNLIPLSPNFYFDKKDKPSGIIFSGGNDLNFLKKRKINKIRDEFELKFLKIALDNKIPILGVCRGFQLVANFFNGEIIRKNGHVKTNHNLQVNNDIFGIHIKNIKVNSFHNFTVNSLPEFFEIIVRDQDTSIEIAYSSAYKILNLMFHPERKNKSQKTIDSLIFSHFKLIK